MFRPTNGAATLDRAVGKEHLCICNLYMYVRTAAAGSRALPTLFVVERAAGGWGMLGGEGPARLNANHPPSALALACRLTLPGIIFSDPVSDAYTTRPGSRQHQLSNSSQVNVSSIRFRITLRAWPLSRHRLRPRTLLALVTTVEQLGLGLRRLPDANRLPEGS